jgi:hypothetical protein
VRIRLRRVRIVLRKGAAGALHCAREPCAMKANR